MNRMFAALLAVGLISIAGCLGSDDDTTLEFPYQSEDGLTHFQETTASGDVHMHWTPGGLAKIQNRGNEVMEITVPEHFIHVSGENGLDGTFSLQNDVTLDVQEHAYYLAPPSADAATINVNGEAVTFDYANVPDRVAPRNQIISGENVWDLSAYQEANFPHREPGFENYYLSAQYFAEYFTDLGMEVEIDPYGTNDLTMDGTVCVNARGGTICPESLLNIVATKPGTDPDAGTIFVAGGHFDMVSGTTHAAFDDTSGTVATLEIARAMSQYDFKHDLKFAIWGGEENGILGSQFWVQSNPIERLNVKSYWNLDVVGMSWPAPIVKPDPIVIAAGLDVPGAADGTTADPYSQALLADAQELQQDWFGFPETGEDVTEFTDGQPIDLWYYEGILSGQVAGYAGVNAQSDHTPFAAAGIPAYFIFNGDTLAGDNPIGIHNERDTLNNMTKYGYYAENFPIEEHAWESEEIREEAKQITAQSWETVLYFPFYHTILVDNGYFEPQGLQTLVTDTTPLPL